MKKSVWEKIKNKHALHELDRDKENRLKNCIDNKYKKVKKDWKDIDEFANFFINGKCYYCGLKNDLQNKEKYFKKGPKRQNCGEFLELDRKDPRGSYDKENMLLACYACNNAKSNVFSSEEFEVIGVAIFALRTRKLNSLKNEKLFKKLRAEISNS